MKTYLVGGAVRDRLLGQTVSEKDWVVVGATEGEMLALGFREVGKGFPVFLHPETNEEYALARIERKVGPGHRGFQCISGPDVTLEEDLERRDLTINSIAETEAGKFIDPHGGRRDLKSKILRHTSTAFREDPLRILRLARFYARYYHLGFCIHEETTQLVESMIRNNELEELTTERVLLEIDKALITKDPAIFFTYLAEVGAARILWPEIQVAAIDRLSRSLALSRESRFALLLQDLDQREIKYLCRRLKTSKNRLELTTLVVIHIETWSKLHELTATACANLIDLTDGLRKKDRFIQFNIACEDITGLNLGDKWQEVRDIMADVKADDIKVDATGSALGKLIRQEQIRRIGNTI
tara:strand:- start:98 stop:1165 length:1068 start_codon:yes stop_codon:yes gene_type:complete